MTKQIRIENADTSDHKVNVYVEDLQADGQWIRGEPSRLDFPTFMFTGHIHQQRRIVVEEATPEPLTGG